jgi:hypothetical protein
VTSDQRIAVLAAELIKVSAELTKVSCTLIRVARERDALEVHLMAQVEAMTDILDAAVGPRRAGKILAQLARLSALTEVPKKPEKEAIS